jgi:hypothetical protein
MARSGSPRLSVPGLLLLVAATGCAASLRGLVAVEPADPLGRPAVALWTPEGDSWRLRLTEESWPLRSLDGCSVQLEGRRWLGQFLVGGWQVLDAGDGSAPFVGRVRRLGSNLVIEDRNSGMALVVDEAPGRLPDLEGRFAMLSGYIVGPQTLRVVSYKILMESTDRGSPALPSGPEAE